MVRERGQYPLLFRADNWAQMENKLLVPGRSACQVKNRWYSFLRTREEKILPDLEWMMGIRSAVRRKKFIKSIAEWASKIDARLEHSKKCEQKRNILRQQSNLYPNVLRIELQRAFPFTKAFSRSGDAHSQVKHPIQRIGGCLIHPGCALP
jgi:hypothetical protein